jgi:hypothetical protein
MEDIMFRFDCTCDCGRSFSMFVEEGSSLKCPYCGTEVAVPSRDRDPSRRHEEKSLEDATSEIMDEGGFAPSGAR